MGRRRVSQSAFPLRQTTQARRRLAQTPVRPVGGRYDQGGHGTPLAWAKMLICSLSCSRCCAIESMMRPSIDLTLACQQRLNSDPPATVESDDLTESHPSLRAAQCVIGVTSRVLQLHPWPRPGSENSNASQEGTSLTERYFRRPNVM